MATPTATPWRHWRAEARRRRRTPRPGRALLLGALLAGCAGVAPDPRLSAPQDTPSFRDGYWHGCRSGIADAGSGVPQWRDRQRREADAGYRAGWEQGHALCLERERQMPLFECLGCADAARGGGELGGTAAQH